MISELDRFHGIVLRQIVVAHGDSLRFGVIETSGRIDAYLMEGAAFLVKHSSKRLPPWPFTFLGENLHQLSDLKRSFPCVWIFFVCGGDGVVGLSLPELLTISCPGKAGSAWVRVRRNRNSMYRVGGALGELSRAKPRGVEGFLSAVFGKAPSAPEEGPPTVKGD